MDIGWLHWEDASFITHNLSRQLIAISNSVNFTKSYKHEGLRRFVLNIEFLGQSNPYSSNSYPQPKRQGSILVIYTLQLIKQPSWF